VTLRVQFPLIESGPSTHVKDSLNVFIQETLLGKFDPHGVAPVLDAVADTVAAQYRGSQDARNPVPWVIERTITVKGDTLGILTFDVKEFRNTDGAHPLSMHLMYMIETASMRILSLDDLVAQDKMATLVTLAESAFRRIRNLAPKENLATAGFLFPGGKFTLTMNVGLAQDGMHFYYNPYEIAPPALGPTEIVLPWERLERVLFLPGTTR